MNLPPDFREALLTARDMCLQGKLLEAERIYRSLATPGTHRGIALEGLAELYLRQQRFDEAYVVLVDLTEHDPESLKYCGQLANLLESAGRLADASDVYQRLLERRPELAIAHFNQARLLKLQNRNEEALAAYEAAVRHEIDQPEEAYTNMGVLYSEMQEDDKARAMYERALEVAPDYEPALYNLAGHLEELGERDAAIALYERILTINPGHWGALARLAYPQKISAENRELVDRLEAGVAAAKDDRVAQETLYFALGKAYDDLESYERATEAYVAANELGKNRVNPYVPAKTEEAFDRLIEIFDADWSSRFATDSDFAPVFVCGMYRSGSTLLERMLGAHPEISAGGEMSLVAWLVNEHMGPFPQSAANATRQQVQTISDRYAEHVQAMFPNTPHVTDKQPDNILRVGLIRAMFPKAKIIQTRRDLRDNCLSLYFQQFGRGTSYATDMRNIAHYHAQQERLFAHWQSCFDDGLLTVDYEDLVDSPEKVLRDVLGFLELEWDDQVLDFQQADGPVKTASIWQVRQGVHGKSKNRWRNYESLVNGLEDGA